MSRKHKLPDGSSFRLYHGLIGAGLGGAISAGLGSAMGAGMGGGIGAGMGAGLGSGLGAGASAGMGGAMGSLAGLTSGLPAGLTSALSGLPSTAVGALGSAIGSGAGTGIAASPSPMGAASSALGKANAAQAGAVGKTLSSITGSGAPSAGVKGIVSSLLEGGNTPAGIMGKAGMAHPELMTNPGMASPGHLGKIVANINSSVPGANLPQQYALPRLNAEALQAGLKQMPQNPLAHNLPANPFGKGGQGVSPMKQGVPAQIPQSAPQGVMGSNNFMGGKVGNYIKDLGNTYQQGTRIANNPALAKLEGASNVGSKMMADLSSATTGAPNYAAIQQMRQSGGMSPAQLRQMSSNMMNRAGMASATPDISSSSGINVSKGNLSTPGRINTANMTPMQIEQMGNTFLKQGKGNILSNNPVLQQEMMKQAGNYANQFGQGGMLSGTSPGGVGASQASSALSQYAQNGLLTPEVMKILQAIYG